MTVTSPRPDMYIQTGRKTTTGRFGNSGDKWLCCSGCKERVAPALGPTLPCMCWGGFEIHLSKAQPLQSVALATGYSEKSNLTHMMFTLYSITKHSLLKLL